jgi:cysteine synthase
MAQKIVVGDKITDTVNGVGTGGQIASVVTRANTNAKSVATVTVPTGNIVKDEDLITLSHTDVNGRQTFVVGQ